MPNGSSFFDFSDEEDTLDVQPPQTAPITKQRDLVAEYARSRRIRLVDQAAGAIYSTATVSPDSNVQEIADESIPGLAEILERLDHEADQLPGEEVQFCECTPDLESNGFDSSCCPTSAGQTSDDDLEAVPALGDLLAEIDRLESVSADFDEAVFDNSREEFLALASVTPAVPCFDDETRHASLDRVYRTQLPEWARWQELDPRLTDCKGARLTGMTGFDGSGTGGDGELHGRVRTLEERCARISPLGPVIAKPKAFRPKHAMPKARDIARGTPRAETWGQSSRMPAPSP